MAQYVANRTTTVASNRYEIINAAKSHSHPDYNEGAQNDHPSGNLNARYRCFAAKPFHDFSPQIRAPQLGGAAFVCLYRLVHGIRMAHGND
jgi:hypothetical protein